MQRSCPIRSQPMIKTRNKARPGHLHNGEYPQMKQRAETKRTIGIKSPFLFPAVHTQVKAKLRQNCCFCGKFSLRTCVFSLASEEVFRQAACCYILCSSPRLGCRTNTRLILQPGLIQHGKYNELRLHSLD